MYWCVHSTPLWHVFMTPLCRPGWSHGAVPSEPCSRQQQGAGQGLLASPYRGRQGGPAGAAQDSAGRHCQQGVLAGGEDSNGAPCRSKGFKGLRFAGDGARVMASFPTPCQGLTPSEPVLLVKSWPGLAAVDWQIWSHAMCSGPMLRMHGDQHMQWIDRKHPPACHGNVR